MPGTAAPAATLPPPLPAAIDFYVTVDRVQGKQGETRVAISFNGKFLPHIEQRADDNTAATGQRA